MRVRLFRRLLLDIEIIEIAREKNFIMQNLLKAIKYYERNDQRYERKAESYDFQCSRAVCDFHFKLFENCFSTRTNQN